MGNGTLTALVCGAGGFIGHHMVRRLKSEGFHVRGVDLKHPEHSSSAADEFIIGDLRDPAVCADVLGRRFDHVYQYAADMGGAAFIFSGENDAAIMHHSAQINLNVLEACRRHGVGRLFFPSSSCVYPAINDTDPGVPDCVESSAYPARPDSEYGWEKLFAERLYLAFARNHGVPVRIARYHNIFGPECVWTGGRERVPAAICRKVINALHTGKHEIEIWGDGEQTRSFMYIDDCLTGSMAIMASNIVEPLNLGSSELVSINRLVDMVEAIAGIKLKRHYNLDAPKGVRGRNSDNTLIREKLLWEPSIRLETGMEKTYRWIWDQMTAQPAALRRAS